MKEVKELLNIKDNDISIVSVKKEIRNGKSINIITLKSTKKKYRCPDCNKYTSSVNDTLKPVRLKHLKIVEISSELYVIKRRFICHKCNKKFIEPLNISTSNSSISNELKMKIRKDLLVYNYSISSIAKENEVSDFIVRKELKEAMEGYPEYVRTLPEVISLDEFKADTNEGKYALIINDPIRKKTLDILPNRKKDYLISYFTRVENRNNVKIVISDMYEPYLLVQKAMFPKAKFIVDRFHFTRYIEDALDDIRIRVQKEYGYNSKEYRILKNKKNVSLMRSYYNDINWYVYTERYVNGRRIKRLPIDILNEILAISDEINRGYQLKEMFLDIVRKGTYENAKEQLLAWIELCEESNIPEFIEASKTISNWLEYIVNSFLDKRYSNGYTEGLNNKIKVIKRNAFGYRNFQFFRLRLLYILNGTISGRSKKKDTEKDTKKV